VSTPRHTTGDTLLLALDAGLTRRQLYALAALLQLPVAGGRVAPEQIHARAWHQTDSSAAARRLEKLLQAFADAGLGQVTPDGGWKWAGAVVEQFAPAADTTTTAESPEERAARLNRERQARFRARQCTQVEASLTQERSVTGDGECNVTDNAERNVTSNASVLSPHTPLSPVSLSQTIEKTEENQDSSVSASAERNAGSNAQAQQKAQTAESKSFELEAGLSVTQQRRKRGECRETPQQAAWFEQIWPTYWRKRPGRKDALKAFAKQIKTEQDFRLLVAGIERDKETYLGRDEENRPQFSTYLNRDEWRETSESLAVVERAPAATAKTPEQIAAEALATDSVFEWSRPRQQPTNGRAA
jgi:hypothetical protein